MAGVTIENYDSYKSSFTSFKNAVTQLDGGKLSAGTIDGFLTSVAGVSVGAFNDAVGQAFKKNQEQNKTDIQKILDDISGGGFNTIKTTITSLEGANGEFETARSNRDRAQAERDKMPEEVANGTKEVWDNPDWRPSYQGGTGGTSSKHTETVYIKNPDIEPKEAEIAKYKDDMQKAVDKINNLLNQIAAADFGGASAADSSSGANTGIPGEGSPYAITDIYTNEGHTRNHVTVDPESGNWIVMDESHYATLYVNNGDGTITVVELGQCYGEDCMSIFSYLNTEGNDVDSLVDAFAYNEFSNAENPSSTFINGDNNHKNTQDGAVTYDIPATVTYTEGPNGTQIPIVSYEGDAYQSSMTSDSNTVMEAYLSGEQGNYDSSPRTYYESLHEN